MSGTFSGRTVLVTGGIRLNSEARSDWVLEFAFKHHPHFAKLSLEFPVPRK